PDHYRALFSEASGNQERQAFVYASRKVRQLRRWAGSRCRRASSRRSNRRARRCPSKDSIGPYLAAFEAGSFQFLLINVHLFFGSEDPEDMARRARETYAVAWWAASRQKSEHAFTKDIIPLGDFNLPALTPETRSCWRL
ncbi:MAG TPA: hypothetical protein VK356_02360, partial [Thermomicrobiales bacterium]|nr:hypothetical protein [Thermomicrobiales bacterium]